MVVVVKTSCNFMSGSDKLYQVCVCADIVLMGFVLVVYDVDVAMLAYYQYTIREHDQ